MTADEATLRNYTEALAASAKEIVDAHRALDAQGVSHSVYGQAARETSIRMRSGGIATPEWRDPAKMFTRAEVLAVLRAEQARHTPVFSANDQTGADKGRQRTLNDLLAIFERME